MGKRLERRIQQQQRVREVTADLLTRQSADAIKMSDIAQSMGVSVGGLYRYYPSKEAIFVSLQIQALTELQAVMERSITAHIKRMSGYTWSLVETLFDAWSIFEQDAPTLARLLNRFAWRTEPLLTNDEQSRVGQHVFQLIELIESTLRRLEAEHVLRAGNANLRALSLWGMVFGLLQLQRRQGAGMQSLPISQIRRSYLDDLKRSWAADA